MALTKKSTPKKPTKTQLKKTAAPKASIIRSGATPVRDLKVYHKNPRIGDIDSIADSLARNGQYRSIVVNIGTTATYKNEVLAGNHTFMAARKLGWDTILADFVDVSDERAKAIVLADNKTAENGTYDEKIIGELLAEVPDVLATGFKPEEADALIEQAGAAASAMLDQMNDAGSLDVSFDPGLGGDDDDASFYMDNTMPAGDDSDVEDFTIGDDFTPEAEPESVESEDITSKPSELGGVQELIPGLPEDPKLWTGPLQLPKLRSDMFVQPKDLPDNLKTWAGSATRDNQPDDQWWFYPWGGDSTKGLRNLDQVIVSFYSWDESFDNWFWTPNRYASKLIHSGIKMAVTPDWSMWETQSRFMNLFSLYRNQYVARYLQEVGIKTIQNLGYPYGDDDFLKNFIFKYIPNSQKVYSMQAMTWNSKEVDGDKESTIIRMDRTMFDHFQPEVLLLYGAKSGREWFMKNIAPAYPDMKVVQLESRLDLLQAWKKSNGGGGGRKMTI